ncbi:hypothetical protein RCO27_12510 [Sphingosinicella sp. LHD-64]|uniref:hypothetical protein n=1 Tax=Sphingosinicella sp. LHD-64 TaxID=3072139 RepID=UPI00280C6583|nr:hypothetical protein [Sphingosinicella sp. LHD-64]MDQ8757051.1 hypothetical protein [Sphingosinicella sp. LHD-64]
MTGTDAGLTGHWTGLYNYPAGGSPVPFEAVLHEISGCVTATTTETSDLLERHGEILHAVIDGRKEGSTVRFLKMYDADEHYDVVHYEGTVHADGDEIDGRWEIPEVWAGTFLMIRAAGAGEERAIKVEEPVGLPARSAILSTGAAARPIRRGPRP